MQTNPDVCVIPAEYFRRLINPPKVSTGNFSLMGFVVISFIIMFIYCCFNEFTHLVNEPSHPVKSISLVEMIESIIDRKLSERENDLNKNEKEEEQQD